MASRTALKALGVAAAVTAALASGLGWFAMRGREDRSGLAHILIGEAMLTAPLAYLRGSTPILDGRLARLDIAATFPDFKPAGQAAGLKSQDDLRARAAHVVFIAITPDDRAVEPADRPAQLYARFLDEAPAQGDAAPVEGLTHRRFQAGSPYEGEDLYLTPPEGRTFWARCPRAAAGAPPEPCLTQISLDGLELTLRFSPALLPNWSQLAAGAPKLVRSMLR